MASIQGIYIALFERPADPSGLAFFNNVTNQGADLTQIGDLAGQREYLDRFVGQSNEQIVRSIYRSLFNREAEQSGVDFFVGRLQRGEININTVAINILDGAQNQDLAIVNNKIAAANSFTAMIDTPQEIAGYSGNSAAQAGRDFIRTVTTSVPDTATITAAVARATGTGSPNNPPNAAADAFATGLNVALTLAPAQLLGNDTDPDSDPLTIASVQGAVNGTVALTSGNVVFTPNQNFSGNGTFTYTASDGKGGTSTATVTVTVGSPPPQAVQLTADVETVTGTTFSAPLINQGGNQVQSLNSGDKLTGTGTGTKLDATLNGSEAGGTKPTINGVSLINLTSVGAAPNIFDATNVQGATAFTSVDSTRGLTINNIGTAATVGITNLQAGDFDHTFRFADVNTSGATDTATLKLNGAGANATAATGIDISLVGQTTGGFETIAVESSGAASRINSITSSLGGTNFLRTINITGDKDLTIDNPLVGVSTLAAGGFAGALRVTADATKDVSFTGGGGNDFLNFAAGLDTNDTVVGGGGRDTVTVTNANGLGIGNHVSGVEVVQFDNPVPAAAIVFDQNNVPSVEAVNQNSASPLTVNNFDSASGADFTKGVTVLNTGPLTVNVEGAIGSITDQLNVTYGQNGPLPSSALQTVAGLTAGGLTAPNVETLNINVLADANGQTALGTGNIIDPAIKTITISGGATNEAFALNNASNNYGAGSAINKIDASTFVGDLRRGAGTGPSDVGISGDIRGETIIAGSGDDVIRDGGRDAPNTPGDKITGGAGKDVFLLGDTVSTSGLPNATVPNGAFTADQLLNFTSLLDLDLGGGGPGSFVDRLNMDVTFNFNGIAQIVSSAPAPINGATFGAAVNSLIAAGGDLHNTGASGTALKAGLYAYNGEEFLIANEASAAATGYVPGDTVVLHVPNVAGTLNAEDIILT
jgi:hypothetical protein